MIITRLAWRQLTTSSLNRQQTHYILCLRKNQGVFQILFRNFSRNFGHPTPQTAIFMGFAVFALYTVSGVSIFFVFPVHLRGVFCIFTFRLSQTLDFTALCTHFMHTSNGVSIPKPFPPPIFPPLDTPSPVCNTPFPQKMRPTSLAGAKYPNYSSASIASHSE